MEQSPAAAARLGKELSANWLRPTSGNLATGLASGAPSFRSSWQIQVNAWRGVSSGTNGVGSEDADEAGTAGSTSEAPKSHAENHGQTSVSAWAASANLQSANAATLQGVSARLTDQKETLPQTSRSAWDAKQSADAQTTSAESEEATAIERPGPTNRNRAGSATQRVNQENAAQGAISGAQTTAPIVEAPIQIPTPAVQSQILKPAQTAEITSATDADFALVRWPSAQPSRSSQLSDEATIASAAAGIVASTTSGNGIAARLRAQTVRTGAALIPPNATESAALHETAASTLLNDADGLAASPQMALLASSEMRSAESQHEQWTARTSVANEDLSGQSLPTTTEKSLTHPTSVESAAPPATTFAAVPDAVEASADTVQSSSTQMTDRVTLRAANRNAAGETVSGTTPVTTVQSGVVEAAASSQLRNPGAPRISSALAPDRQQAATANSGAASAQDTFSALDSGTSPGTPTLTHAGSQHAEAGFRDPALGWVGVRADLSVDGIHATLVPGSAEAAQALNGHLAGLSSHLVEQQSPVASLTMASPNERGIENGMGQRMQQGAEGNSQGNAPDESPAGSQFNAPPVANALVQDASAQAGIRDSFTHTGELRGTHISVMA